MREQIKLPKYWKWVKLGEVTINFDGKRVPLSKVVRSKKKGKYRYYGATEIVDYIDEYIFDGKYLLIGEDGANLVSKSRDLAFIVHGQFWVNNHAHVLQTKNNLILEYLHYYFNSLNLSQFVTGTAQPKLNQGNLNKIPISLPPLPTQISIVSKIEELFSELDKGIENLKTAQAQLKTYRQSVLKWAFEGRLTNKNVKDGELPKGWKNKELKDIITLSAEKHKPTKAENLFYIGLEHIEKHSGKLTPTVGIEKVTTIKNKFNSGDILYGKLRPNLNKCYLAKEEGVCSTDILVLKLSSECLGEFLHQIMLSTGFVNEMSENTSGVNLPRVSTKFILEYKIPLPPVAEQERIIKEIERRLSVADKMEENITQSLQQAEALRQSILKKAFEGELVKEVVETKQAKVDYFTQAQIQAYIIKYSNDKQIRHGEMTAAKYSYLIDKVYNIPTQLEYQRWHLGPYSPAIKKIINNKKFFAINKGCIELAQKHKAFDYPNPYKVKIETAINELSGIFLKYPEKERAHKIELLATVCKVIEDIKSTDLKLVRASMKEWKIELKTTNFKSKAEKFSETETKKCVDFIKERGWESRIINSKQ